MIQEGRMQSGNSKPPKTLPPLLEELLLGYSKSKALFTAVRLGIFDALASRPSTIEELAETLSFSADAGERLLMACTALGLLHWDGNCYHNMELTTKYLLTDAQESAVPIILHADSVQYPLWQFLLEGVRENHIQCYRAFGKQGSLLGDDLFRNEAGARRFLAAMHWRSSAACQAELAMLDLSGIRHLLDIGGGTGAFCTEAARRFPHLKATILELPHICPITQEYIDYANMQDRVGIVAGDFFNDPLPGSPDAIVATLVLHDWPEPKQIELLRKIAVALPSEGKLIIAERFMPEDKKGPLPAIFMNINMLLATGGIEHTANKWRSLLQQCGFKDIQAILFPHSSRDLLIASAP